MADWDWKCVRDWPVKAWQAVNCGHRIEAWQMHCGNYIAFEDDIQIISHITGRPMWFKTVAEVRRWFDDQRRIQNLFETPT